MNLFDSHASNNLLPCDGVADYYGRIVPQAAADRYYEALLHSLAWQHDEAVLYGKRYITPRQVAWYGDAGFRYSYSGSTKTALPWTAELKELRAVAASYAGQAFNSCLANLYRTGGEGMAWHSDNEKALGANTVIASFSFGAERVFRFKHKADKRTVPVILEHGSLLVMHGTTQTHWLHCLPRSKKVHTPRINLTFRTIVGQG